MQDRSFGEETRSIVIHERGVHPEKLLPFARTSSFSSALWNGVIRSSATELMSEIQLPQISPIFSDQDVPHMDSSLPKIAVVASALNFDSVLADRERSR